MNLYNEIIYRLYEIGQTLEDIEFISIYNRYEFKELELNKDEFLNFLAKEDIGTGNSYFTVFLDYDIIVYATESGEVVNAECIFE